MQRVSLIGYRACGKSTVGPLVADRLGWAFCDLDALITLRIGMPIAAFFAAQGEAAFRAEETAALRVALSGTTPLVLATGGGCVLKDENRAILRESGGLCAYIAAPAAVLSQRLRQHAGGRPSLTGVPVADEVEHVLRLREPLYRLTANVVLDGTLGIKTLVEELVRIVENSGEKSPHSR